MSNDIKKLNLTERDFQLIVEGLEHLPKRGDGGEFMAEMLIGAVSRTDEQRSDLEKKLDAITKKRQAEKAMLKEDVTILQGKLLQLKRYLTENNLMDQISEHLA